MSKPGKLSLWVVALVLIPLGVSRAQIRRGPVRAGAANGPVSLPYVFNNSGSQWYIYQDGALHNQGGRQPVYGTAAQLLIDGNQFADNTNSANMDNGELVLNNTNQSAVTVTRRIFLSSDDPLTRIIDVYHNTTSEAKVVNITLQSEFSWGLQNSQLISDPKHQDNKIGWVGMSSQGRCGLEIFAGKGCKLFPTINSQNQNNMVQATMALTVPGNKEVALMHLHGIVATIDAGTKMLADLKESDLLKQIDLPLRKEIVNFPSSQSWIGDVEILRGDAFDVVELRGGDQLRGTLQESSYVLDTFYGHVELPVDRVIGLINVGQYRPRQLIITNDGEIFSGRMAKTTIGIAMSNGQTVQIPLAQISRAGYRKQNQEADEWVFDKPMVMMRSGDRVEVQMPTDLIDVMTRYGSLKLAPAAIAAIVFQSEENGVHNIFLTDGSKFAGIVATPAFDYKLSGSGPSQVVHFSTDSIMRMQLAVNVADSDKTTPQINLSNQDLLVGTVMGKLKLETTFDSIDLDGPQIRKIDRAGEVGGNDVQVTLWDGSVISGQLDNSSLSVHLQSGADVSVPVAMLSSYDQPLPQPSAEMVKQIEESVTLLSDKDPSQREAAAASLAAMGPPVMGKLKELRAAQGPEAQQLIDSIIKKLEASMATPRGQVGMTGGPQNYTVSEVGPQITR